MDSSNELKQVYRQGTREREVHERKRSGLQGNYFFNWTEGAERKGRAPRGFSLAGSKGRVKIEGERLNVLSSVSVNTLVCAVCCRNTRVPGYMWLNTIRWTASERSSYARHAAGFKR